MLAPSTRCYYHGHGQCHYHYHLRRAQIGSRIAGRPPRRQSTGVKALRWSGGGSQACHRKLGPLGQDLAPIDAHHVARDSRGQELLALLASADDGGRTIGPSNGEGSRNVPDLAATLPASLYLWASTERTGHHASTLAERPALKQTRRLSSPASPKGTGPHARNRLPISASP